MANCFLKEHGNHAGVIHSEWSDSVSKCRQKFYDAIGIQYSPSKVELVKRKSMGASGDESDTNVDGIPLYPSADVDAFVAGISGQWSPREVVEFLKTHFTKLGGMPVIEFWSTCVEAVSRVRQSEMLEILDELRSFLEVTKLSKKQRPQHLLFLEFFKLRVYLAKSLAANLVDVLTSVETAPFRGLYMQLSSLELRSLARSRAPSITAVFLLQELLPFFIRDIPFSFLEKVSTTAFDLELTPQDADALWRSDINNDLPKNWRLRHPLHRWDESFSKSQKRFLVDEPVARTDAEAVTVVYEAPWVPPSLAKAEQPAPPPPRRQSVGVPARALKMEGRRQSYKPSPNEGGASDALCVVQDSTDDGFMISRGVLDAMREWNHEDQQPAQSMLSDQPIGDVLLDLLHSPPQPSTRVGTPVKETKKRSFEVTPQTCKRVKRSPTKDIDAHVSETSNSENYPPDNSSLIKSFLIESTVPSEQVFSENRTNSPKTALKAPKAKIEERKTERADRRRARDEDDYHTLNLI